MVKKKKNIAITKTILSPVYWYHVQYDVLASERLFLLFSEIQPIYKRMLSFGLRTLKPISFMWVVMTPGSYCCKDCQIIIMLTDSRELVTMNVLKKLVLYVFISLFSLRRQTGYRWFAPFTYAFKGKKVDCIVFSIIVVRTYINTVSMESFLQIQKHWTFTHLSKRTKKQVYD